MARTRIKPRKSTREMIITSVAKSNAASETTPATEEGRMTNSDQVTKEGNDVVKSN